MDKDKKDIEIVSGDGKDLDISSVSTHIPASKPKIKENAKEIVIPTEKKAIKKNE